jgi:hypothetical protein
LGQTIISVAPFVGIPSVLLLIGAIFDLVPMFHCDMTWGHRPSWDVGSMVVGTFSSAFDLIWGNLVGNGSFWFLIFLYLAASMTVALAPSKKDLGNSWLGTTVLVVLVVLWAAFNDLFLSDLGWEAPVSYFLMDVMGWIVALGLVLCLLGLIVGLLPFLIRMALMKRKMS